MKVVHNRCAIRLRDMCAQNLGVYIKLGQHIAMLDHLFPEEYHHHLSSLLSKTPQSSYEAVRRCGTGDSDGSDGSGSYSDSSGSDESDDGDGSDGSDMNTTYLVVILIMT